MAVSTHVEQSGRRRQLAGGGDVVKQVSCRPGERILGAIQIPRRSRRKSRPATGTARRRPRQRSVVLVVFQPYERVHGQRAVDQQRDLPGATRNRAARRTRASRLTRGAGEIASPLRCRDALSDPVEPDEFSARLSAVAAPNAVAVRRHCVDRGRRVGRFGAPGLIAVVSRPHVRSRGLSGAWAARLDDGSAAGELTVAAGGRLILLRLECGVALSPRPRLGAGPGCPPCP
jgi:hypothetical protein